MLACDAFDDCGDFLESVSCETSKTCQVRGSNPCRGAIAFLPQLVALVLLTAAPGASLARIRYIPQIVASRAVSLVGREVLRGCEVNSTVEARAHVFICEFSGFSG